MRDPAMRRTLFLALACLSLTPRAHADDIERAPIHYNSAVENNPVARLQKRLAAKSPSPPAETQAQFLRAMLEELAIPESSQTLVFSRTSLQRQKISPATPRAIYFNDEVYLGYCQESPLLELTATDPNLGAVFYALEHRPGKRPLLTRQNEACLSCHASSATRGLPGHLVRSVFPDREGYPLFALGTFRVDQRTPFKDRWGGWYVTAKSQQAHLGNQVYTERDGFKQTGLHRESLDDLCDLSRYLHGHSDIVALLVLEHQAEMQNLLTRAGMQTRFALHYDAELYKELGQAGQVSASTWRRIYKIADEVVAYLLFAEEAPLPARIEGTSSFTRDFASLGPRDRKGRSLREFDLQRRIFKYPCSYLIYSPQFAGLPAEVRERIDKRLRDVLTGEDNSDAFAHLSAADRKAIFEILTDTLPGFR
jgi:hypothetical protein